MNPIPCHPQIAGVKDSIAVAHYLKTNLSSDRVARLRSKPGQLCGVRRKDVPVPPHLPAVGQPEFLTAGLRPAKGRSIRLFFAGNVPDSQLAGFDQRTDEDLVRYMYIYSFI